MKKLKNNSLISLFIVFCTITVFNAPTLAALTDLDINNKAGSPTLIPLITVLSIKSCQNEFANYLLQNNCRNEQ